MPQPGESNASQLLLSESMLCGYFNYLGGYAMRLTVLLFTLFAAVFAQPVLAQEGAARYSGSWQATVGDGGTGTCRIELRRTNGMFGLSATTLGCLGPLAMVNNWTTSGGNVHLLGFMGETIATFSPGNGVLDGRFAEGAPVILAPRSGQVVAAQVPIQHSCIQLVGSRACATSGDIAVPQSYPLKVRSFGVLNIRAQPSPDAPVVGQIKAAQCFTIDACYKAADGIRCHVPAAPGVSDGYVAKQFFSRDGATLVGFQNFC